MEVREISPRYVLKASQHRTSSLPVDWKLIRVQDAGEVLGGRQRSPSAQGDLTPYLRVANVFAGRIDTSDVLQMPFTAEERARFALRAGDILLNEGQSLELVGRSAIYRDEPPNCCFQNTLVRFRAGSRTDPTFAQYLFESYLLRGEFSKIALQTTSIAHLGAGRFAQMAFVAPPLEEQKAIGQSLADADALIDSLEQLLTKKRQIKQGTMQELLTGKRRLPGFSSAWTDGVLDDVVAELIAGVSVNSDSTGGADGVPSVVKTSALKSGVFDPSECKPIVQTDLGRATTPLRQDTLLISRMNTPDLVGEVGYVDRDYDWLYLPDRIWMTRMRSPDCVCVRWLGYLLNSSPYKRLIGDTATGTSGSMKNIAKSGLLGLPLSFPGLSEQRAIADILSDIDVEVTTLESRLTKARALKQAMAQALLTGRIRIPLSPQAPALTVPPPEGVGALGSGPARTREPTA